MSRPVFALSGAALVRLAIVLPVVALWASPLFAKVPDIALVLVSIGVVVGPFAILAAGRLPPIPLLIFSIAAAAMSIARVLYAYWTMPFGVEQAAIFLFPIVGLELGLFFFVLYCIVVSMVADRRWRAHYSTYFETSWTLATQLLLTGVAVVAFWVATYLAVHFLTGIVGSSNLPRFDAIFPATFAVWVAALHATEAYGARVTAVREAILSALAWLSPLATIAAAAGLVWLSLGDTTQLWADGWATALSLGMAFPVIVAINAQIREGRPPDAARRLPRYACLAAVAVLPLTIAFAAAGLWTRQQTLEVDQLTVIGTAWVAVLGSHAVGYVVTAARSGIAMRGVPRVNLMAAAFGLLLTVAMWTPLLDCNRLAVAWRVNQLEAGRIAPDKFDYEWLRFGASQFGEWALERLAYGYNGPNAEEVARRAREARGQDFPKPLER